MRRVGQHTRTAGVTPTGADTVQNKWPCATPHEVTLRTDEETTRGGGGSEKGKREKRGKQQHHCARLLRLGKTVCWTGPARHRRPSTASFMEAAVIQRAMSLGYSWDSPPRSEYDGVRLLRCCSIHADSLQLRWMTVDFCPAR